MSKEEERLINYNYNELGQEFGDLIVDIRNERDKYKEVLDTLQVELEREIEFGKTIKQTNSNIGIRHTLEKVLERINELLEEIE